MTSSREKVKSNGPRPRVCVCGYDLAGLGDEAGARCPECGMRIDQLREPTFWSDGQGWYLLAAMLPAIVAGPVCVIVNWRLWSFDQIAVYTWLGLAGIFLLASLSAPASFVLAVSVVRTTPLAFRIVAGSGAVLVCVVANATIALTAWMLVSAIMS